MKLETLLTNAKKHAKKTLVAGLASSMLFLSACGNGGSRSPEESSGEDPITDPGYSVTEETYVLDQNDLDELSSVEPNRLVFNSSMPNLDIGSVIIADISGMTPDGLLRLVTYASTDQMTFDTTQATLEDVFENLSFQSQGSINQNNALIYQKSPSQLNLGVLDFNVNFDDIIIYDIDLNLNTTDDQIVLSGNISFSSDLNLDLAIENRRLTRIIFENTTNVSSDLEIIATPTQRGILRLIDLASFDLPSFVLGYTPTVPPIPIIVKPQIDVSARIFGNFYAQTQMSVSQDTILTAGITYENGQWDSYSDFSNDFSFVPPNTFTSSGFFDSMASVEPKLNFLLYGIAGPSAGIEGSLFFSAGNLQWNLSGGLEVSVGIDMGILSSTVPDYSVSVINRIFPLTKGNVVQPDPETVIIQPGTDGRDTYVRWSSISGSIANNNYNTTILELDLDSGRSSEEILIQFPLSSIPSGSTIDFAKLNLHGYCVSNLFVSTAPTRTRELLGNWSESTATWNNKPGYGSINSISYVPVPGRNDPTWNEWDLTTLVQGWVNGTPNYGVALTLGINESQCYFKSSEHSTTSLRPKLEVTYFQ